MEYIEFINDLIECECFFTRPIAHDASRVRIPTIIPDPIRTVKNSKSEANPGFRPPMNRLYRDHKDSENGIVWMLPNHQNVIKKETMMTQPQKNSWEDIFFI